MDAIYACKECGNTITAEKAYQEVGNGVFAALALVCSMGHVPLPMLYIDDRTPEVIRDTVPGL